MSHLSSFLTDVAPWLGVALIGLIFVANAIGLLNQAVAVQDLTTGGVSATLAEALVRTGRLLQAIAVPCLFISHTRPFAALALTGFLLVATVTAHAFWKISSTNRIAADRQLASFLKNVAIIGGLLLIAGWRS